MSEAVAARGAGRRSRDTRRDWRDRVPSVVAGVLTVLALLCAVAAVSAAFHHRVQWARVAVDELLMPAPANLGYAAFVGVLAVAVAHRKRVAFWMLVVGFGLQAAADLALFGVYDLIRTSPSDYWENDLKPFEPWLAAGNLVLTVAVIAVLAVSHRQFYARVQRASLPKALATVVVMLGFFSVVGWGLVEAFPGSLRTNAHEFTYAAEKVSGGAFVFDIARSGRAPGWVNLVLGLFGAISLFASLYVLFRSQRAAAALAPDDERRVRALLAASGERDSLGYFATRRDKSVVFSSTGKAAVTYRVVAGVCLASGDPIGDPEAWPPAIAAWLELCRAYAWTPAVMGASTDGATAYARAGLRVLQLGDEAIIHVRDFTLDGRDMRPVRQAVNRVRRAGYTSRIRRHADISSDEMARIIDLAARWRDTETERGFSMALGRLGDPADGRCVLVEALDAQGREVALLSFTPWGTTGLSLDLMRRDRSSDNGLMEFMVAELVAAAPQLAVERISMNFAVFRSVFEEGARIGAGPILRAWRGFLLFFSRWFQLESLYRSNVKYRPEWVPRYVCFEDIRDLAKVGLASGIAEGFVVVPSLRTLLRRGAARPAEALPEEVSVEPEPAVVTDAPSAAVPALPEQTRVRLAKVEALRVAGVEPYPPGFARTRGCGEIRAAYARLAPDTATGEQVAVAGRVMLVRDHGGLLFATLRDWSGDVQVMLDRDVIGDWKRAVDLGDHVGVTGEVITTRRGEVSVRAASWTLTAKCLHPLPNKHRGLTDPEALVRQRHLDLIVNAGARDMLRVRSAALHAVRTALIDRGYLEVETPILQRVHGGANARPFTTHINAYDMRLYLRIAPELYLKRLAVGGVEKVFELGRDFRNEGADATHNPEFTMLEAYEAYGDYVSMRALARDLVIGAATAAYGAPVVRRGDAEIDVSGEWPVVPVYEAISLALGEKIDPDTSLERLRDLAGRAGVPVQPGWGPGHVVLEMYERLVEANTEAPTFYTDFPTEVSPLTRAHRDDPRLAERWDLVAFGMELGTAYTELIDPVEQRRRLTAQSLLAAGGDPEAMELDEDFLHTLEYAMPPTGGLGMGIDRLVMLLTGRSIRETLPFPLVKPTS
ncbi:bifunctional lysylphosphatidylglycerol synthetase/lysine--tRNA ligase LysX [Planosporangium thailandense]|uniref:Lysine--tRNA ligase n=1 Tax=Planosporangium thailandense TaxID=765197 RepID=A0ABX0Y8I6_9ACTN|nr:bifunctional lysylphosphatidylglycerol synthetase/lysine--tRNA ligase LysX [Planosporangium thailandense]